MEISYEKPRGIATLFALIASSACGKIIGIDEYGVGDHPRGNPSQQPGDGSPDSADARQAGADAGPKYRSDIFPFPFASAACRDCADTYCSTEETECARDPDCKLWAACRAACTDERCIAGCPWRVPRANGVGGKPRSVASYGVCLFRDCEQPCLAKFPDIDMAMSGDCYDCTVQECGDPLGEPWDTRAVSFVTCTGGPKCGARCGAPDWDCLDHVEWGKPTSYAFPVSFNVGGNDSANPGIRVEGALVKACSSANPDCSAPLAEAVTDGTGWATFIFDHASQDGLFNYWMFSAPGYITTLNWMVPPPVREGSDLRTQVTDTWRAALASTGADLSKYGAVGLYQEACNAKPAPGVTLEVVSQAPDAPPPIYYFLSDSLQIVPGATQTGASGYFGALNIAEGFALVRTRRVQDNAIISEVPVTVKRGLGTFLTMRPTPRLQQ